jgi:hypothetical protein
VADTGPHHTGKAARAVGCKHPPTLTVCSTRSSFSRRSGLALPPPGAPPRHPRGSASQASPGPFGCDVGVAVTGAPVVVSCLVVANRTALHTLIFGPSDLTNAFATSRWNLTLSGAANSSTGYVEVSKLSVSSSYIIACYAGNLEPALGQGRPPAGMSFAAVAQLAKTFNTTDHVATTTPEDDLNATASSCRPRSCGLRAAVALMASASQGGIRLGPIRIGNTTRGARGARIGGVVRLMSIKVAEGARVAIWGGNATVVGLGASLFNVSAGAHLSLHQLRLENGTSGSDTEGSAITAGRRASLEVRVRRAAQWLAALVAIRGQL